jgi:hypothetical protein
MRAILVYSKSASCINRTHPFFGIGNYPLLSNDPDQIVDEHILHAWCIQ